MWCLRQEELLHLSIHNLTWQESNIGRFVNHNISIQSKIVQELFEDVYMVCCVTENDFRIFPPTKPPSKTWKRLFRISFFPFNSLNPKSDQYQISPCNSDAL